MAYYEVVKKLEKKVISIEDLKTNNQIILLKQVDKHYADNDTTNRVILIKVSNDKWAFVYADEEVLDDSYSNYETKELWINWLLAEDSRLAIVGACDTWKEAIDYISGKVLV